MTEFDTKSLRRAFDEAISKLKARQRAVLNAVVSIVLPGVSSSNLDALVVGQGALRHAESHVFFLNAPGITGKTFLRALSLASSASNRKTLIACTASAVSAVLLEHGLTAHSTFKIQITITAEHLQHFREIPAGRRPFRYRLHYRGWDFDVSQILC